MSTTENGSLCSYIGRPDCLYGGGTPEVERQDTVTTSFNYGVDGRSCECNRGVITTCPPTPARPSNNNMLALVVEEEDTRATKRVKMKYGNSNHTNHHCDMITRLDSEMGARCSGGNDSPACWLENGAIFKPIQAILTDEREEPWNEEGRQVRSSATMNYDDNILDMHQGDFIASLHIQLMPGVPHFSTLQRGIRSFVEFFQKADEEALIVPRVIGKERMISLTDCSTNFSYKLEDMEKYILVENKWLVYHRPTNKETLQRLKAKKQVGPTAMVAHIRLKTTMSPSMIKDMIQATQIEMSQSLRYVKVSIKHLQCWYSSTRYAIVGVDTSYHSVGEVKSAILSSLATSCMEDKYPIFNVYQRRLKSFYRKDLVCTELSFEGFRRSEQLAFHIEARDSDWNILAPLLSSMNGSNKVKTLFGESAHVVKIPQVARPKIEIAKLYQSLCVGAMESKRSLKVPSLLEPLDPWLEANKMFDPAVLKECSPFTNMSTNLNADHESQSEARQGRWRWIEVKHRISRVGGIYKMVEKGGLRHTKASNLSKTEKQIALLGERWAKKELDIEQKRKEKQQSRAGRPVTVTKGGLDDRERGNLSKTEKSADELDDDSSCKFENG